MCQARGKFDDEITGSQPRWLELLRSLNAPCHEIVGEVYNADPSRY
jgi:hypothetical protein